MLQVKQALDPNNIMNPGKYLLDLAYTPDAAVAPAALRRGSG
jgi:glycolate oxidase